MRIGLMGLRRVCKGETVGCMVGVVYDSHSKIGLGGLGGVEKRRMHIYRVNFRSCLMCQSGRKENTLDHYFGV